MPEKFEGQGLCFLFPETWKLEEDTSAKAIIVESPTGSFVSISDCGENLDTAFQEAQSLMAEEYEEIEKEPLEREFAGETFEGLVQRFVYLDLIITSTIWKIIKNDRQLLIQTQGEDRELQSQQIVFDAIVTSLLQNLVE